MTNAEARFNKSLRPRILVTDDMAGFDRFAVCDSSVFLTDNRINGFVDCSSSSSSWVC